jgi:hypothetical protein
LLRRSGIAAKAGRSGIGSKAGQPYDLLHDSADGTVLEEQRARHLGKPRAQRHRDLDDAQRIAPEGFELIDLRHTRGRDAQGGGKRLVHGGRYFSISDLRSP